LFRRRLAFARFILAGWITFAASAGAQNVAVTVRHSSAYNGQSRVEGSVQQLLGETVSIQGGAVLTEDLLVPGTPSVQVSGNATLQGTLPGTGSSSPAGYQVQLGGGASVRYVRTRTDAVAMPAAPAPPLPAGTQDVTINHTGQTVGNWAAVRDFTLTGNVGTYAVPPGTYRALKATAGNTLVLGVTGATTPAVYNLQTLSLSAQASVQLAGPVLIKVNDGFSAPGHVGASPHPEWLEVRVTAGGVALSGGAHWYGRLVAPGGTVTVAGQSELCGTLACDKLSLDGNSVIRWCKTNDGGANQQPVANAQSVSTAEDTAKPILLTATDPDSFLLTYTIVAQPQHGSLDGALPNVTYTPFQDYFGSDSFTFSANDGTSDSAPAAVQVTVTPVNDATRRAPFTAARRG